MFDSVLSAATWKSSRFASRVFTSSSQDSDIRVTSKIPGFAGNRIQFTIQIDGNPGPPVFTLDGNVVKLRMPSKIAFEASGPFQFNGVTPSTFLMLWYSGDYNDRESFATDGLPVSWPLNRDGEFVIWAEGSWRMIRRESGSELMHWKSDSSHMAVNLTPNGALSSGNPEGWHGVAPGCTGWISAHYAVDHAEAQNISYFLAGDEAVAVSPNPQVTSRISIAVPEGQDGTGRISSQSAYLSGGR